MDMTSPSSLATYGHLVGWFHGHFMADPNPMIEALQQPILAGCLLLGEPVDQVGSHGRNPGRQTGWLRNPTPVARWFIPL